jgi:hypothetical protein
MIAARVMGVYGAGLMALLAQLRANEMAHPDGIAQPCARSHLLTMVAIISSHRPTKARRILGAAFAGEGTPTRRAPGEAVPSYGIFPSEHRQREQFATADACPR